MTSYGCTAVVDVSEFQSEVMIVNVVIFTSIQFQLNYENLLQQIKFNNTGDHCAKNRRNFPSHKHKCHTVRT